MLSLTEQEYEIYSTILNTYYSTYPPMRIWNWTGVPRGKERIDITSLGTRYRLEMRRHPGLIDDFELANQRSAEVAPLFTTYVDYSIIPTASGEKGWQLSRIGFSDDSYYALAMIALSSPYGCGRVVMCHQEEDEWRFEEVGGWCT